MSGRNCPPFLAGIAGFVLGVVVVKLAQRFCPFCRTCCCAETGCCCRDEAEPGESCCCDETPDSPSGEAETPAE